MKITRWERFLVIATLVAACTTPTAQGPAEEGAATSTTPFVWVQYAPDSMLSARTIIPGGDCPSLLVDGKARVMTRRGEPTSAFAVTVCEALFPVTARSALLSGVPLPLPKANPERIVVLGDTGCRIKRGHNGQTLVQNCHDPHAWPFPEIARTVAALKPDVVVHVGDYHYRESPCPQNHPECAGSFSGDTWQSWQQDYFLPAQPLFAAAPLVLIRGNHEECRRSGKGWFYFLDPFPYQACSDAMDPYSVPLGADLNMAVIDAAVSQNIQPSLLKLKLKPGVTWLGLHRPFLTPHADLDEAGGEQVVLPPALQAQGAISAVIVGHVHLQAFNVFKDERPPELIIGNGGDLLDHYPEMPRDQVTAILEKKDFTSFLYEGFGFVIFDRIGAQRWAVSARDYNDKPVFDCMLTQKPQRNGALTCDQAQ